MTFINLIVKIPFIILLISLFIGLFNIKRLDKLHKAILLYLMVMLLIDIISKVLKLYGNNHIVLLIYSLVELLLITFFYYKYMLINKSKLLLTLSLVGACYIFYEIVNYIVSETNVKSFQPYSKVVDNFIIILLAFSYFLESINKTKNNHWKYFKLNAVILIFFTLNTIIFLPFNFLINESTGVKFYFWSANILMISIFYIYLTFLIIQNSKRISNIA